MFIVATLSFTVLSHAYADADIEAPPGVLSERVFMLHNDHSLVCIHGPNAQNITCMTSWDVIFL